MMETVRSGAFADNVQIAKHAACGRRGVVAAQNRKAAVIGAEILAAGGNAADAAIATSLALAACEPWMSGLGGGATMLVFSAESGRVDAIDAGMVAPAVLDPIDYPLTGGVAGDLFGWPAVLDDRNLEGPLSFAVPGQLAGLGLLHERFGSMPWAELVAPARMLAAEGLEIDWYAALLVATGAPRLAAYEGSRAVYLPGGLPPVPSQTTVPARLALGALAETLALVAAEGPGTLYRGGLADAVVADLRILGGRLAAGDLESYAARLVEPLHRQHGNADVFAMPGLFAGSTLLECLECLAGSSLVGDRPDISAFRAFADALKAAWAKRLTTAGHAADSPAPGCTSHLAVVDAAGNMVSLTQTLLSLFGSKVVLPRSGILMNNGIMWFDPRPGRPNSIAPGKRPLSNMCPVITANATRRIGLGASGGRRILPAVLQILSFVLDYSMSLEEAFAQARIDVAGDGSVTMSRDLPAATREALEASHGASVIRTTVYPMAFACPVAVLHDLAKGMQHGTAEVVHPWADAVAVG